MGTVRLYTAPLPPPKELRRAELLLVRSVTRVDTELLQGSPVRVVGTASAGTDHIDAPAMHAAGIRVYSAAGCNARAVAEYTLAALCLWCTHRKRVLSGMRAGIIGCGHIGERVAAWLELLGVACMRNDPPLEKLHPHRDIYVPLVEALQADIVSLHVPYTTSGAHRTHHLIGAAQLAQMRPGAVLLNTSRGGVVDEIALLTCLQRQDLHAVIDTWEHEPKICRPLAARADLATPHIAGYSQRAKERATRMLYQQICAPDQGALEPSPPQTQALRHHGPLPCAAILAACDLYPCARALQAQAQDTTADLTADFVRQRAAYPLRREFAEYHMLQACPTLQHLGFAPTPTPAAH